VSTNTKVAIVGTVGLPAQYGGFETLARYLVEYLGKYFDFTVYCSGPDYAQHEKSYHEARLCYIPLRANGAQSIFYDGLSLFDACLRADVILLLGVSGAIFLPLANLTGKKIILNIGGLDWQRSKWGRWASQYLHFSERMAVRAATTLIADNDGIAEYLLKTYRRASYLIEYGGDQTTQPDLTAAERERYPFLAHPYAFDVARIQSDNNIEMILEAFSHLSDKDLVLVGNWASSTFGRRLKQRYRGYPNLHLLEAIYDPQELNLLRSHCAVYVHGHSAGGTNPSLVEAMYLGLPIAAYDVVFNRATTENAARYYRDAIELETRMKTMSTAEWESLRAPLREIALRRYCWKTIAAKYASIF
jgi:glycosyltransferase involved in cell wall biosynthesis